MKTHKLLDYYGSKYRLAPQYPAPRNSVVIEPFAGGAGYSLRYFKKKVILYDLNERLISVWQYLIKSKPDEILKLPLIELDSTLDDYPQLTQEQKWLIGWWLQPASGGSPYKRYSNFARNKLIENPNDPSVWSAERRERIAVMSGAISHWEAYCQSYETIPNREATWFIDPPYEGQAGKRYRHGSHNIDFDHLAEWCKGREGFAIVCENDDSRKWLPFTPFANSAGAKRKSEGGMSVRSTTEVIWCNQRMYEQEPLF